MTIKLHIKPLTLQCEVCGRIRTGGPGSDWVRDDSVEPAVVGLCAMCRDGRRRAVIRQDKAKARMTRRNARTPHPVKEMTDEDWKDFIDS